MIGRRATVGLSLLCALVLCAFAAQSASAKGTTAFTCEPKTGVLGSKGFADEHCDVPAENTAVKFVHGPAITEGAKTEVEITNEKTAEQTKKAAHETTKFTFIGIKVEITCEVVSGTGILTNVIGPKAMQVQLSNYKIKRSKCKVVIPLKEGKETCTVAEPIEEELTGITREELGAGKNEMGIEFTPASGSVFSKIEFKNKEAEKCALNGLSAEIEGSEIATAPGGGGETAASSGTFLFTNAMTKETLKAAGKAVETEGTYTMRMKKEVNPGNPISITTTAT